MKSAKTILLRLVCWFCGICNRRTRACECTLESKQQHIRDDESPTVYLALKCGHPKPEGARQGAMLYCRACAAIPHAHHVIPPDER